MSWVFFVGAGDGNEMESLGAFCRPFTPTETGDSGNVRRFSFGGSGGGVRGT